MPSFLSKVFGRKKQDEKEASQARTSDATLLEGKFEAVSPPTSPINSSFVESQNGKDKEGGFPLFKSKSRQYSPMTASPTVDLPQLSLNLTSPQDDNASPPFLNPVAPVALENSVIGEKRLNPSETLALVKSCSQVITTRGLETLGIMHPHWYSASPDAQRKIISLFIQSLNNTNPSTSNAPPSASFDTELTFSRSPHDVAGVLRWALRHLKLESPSFGKEDGEWTWYTNFAEGERAASFPPKAFSEYLAPQLTSIHLELLTTTLEILSSLAAHAEANSTSGSKLSKFLGLWLLTAIRTKETDDWASFYARWERAGRILEHLFLARIREETNVHRMPTRLLELVHHYPYDKGTPNPLQDEFLPRPRFSTRQYDALHVRITSSSTKTREHPITLISESFKAEQAFDDNKHAADWESIKAAALSLQEGSATDDRTVLSRIFADETIRVLSLIPAESTSPASPAFSLSPAQRPEPARGKRSFSHGDQGTSAASANGNGHTKGHPNGHAKAGTSASATTPSTSSAVVPKTDWKEFSASGFLETSALSQPLASTLLDKDVERTDSAVSPRASRRRKPPSPRGRIPLGPSSPEPAAPKAELVTPKATHASIVQLDEAFVDFWSDALLDPISADWPVFVICKLKKAISGLESLEERKVEWLIIEHSFSIPSNSAGETQNAGVDSARPRPRQSSPKPSYRSDTSGMSLAKRFSIFSSSRRSTDTKVSPTVRKKTGQSPGIGEMGEMAEEEVKMSPKPEAPAATTPSTAQKSNTGLGIAGIGAGLAAVATGAAATAEAVHASVQPKEESEPTVKDEPVAQEKEAKEEPITGQPLKTQAEQSEVAAEEPVLESQSKLIPEAKAIPVEPPHTDSVPIVQVTEEPAEPVAHEEDAAVPSTVDEPSPEQAAPPLDTSQLVLAEAGHAESLPPAPESVVTSGETPGPHVALSTSEPAALAHVSPSPTHPSVSAEDLLEPPVVEPTLVPTPETAIAHADDADAEAVATTTEDEAAELTEVPVVSSTGEVISGLAHEESAVAERPVMSATDELGVAVDSRHTSSVLTESKLGSDESYGTALEQDDDTSDTGTL